MKKKLFLSLLILFSVLIVQQNSVAQRKLLVDFGSSSANNVFNTNDFPGWTNVQLSSETSYISAGSESGTTMLSTGSSVFANFQSISGPSRLFKYGDRIYISWYNSDTENAIIFRPLISFTDLNNPADIQGEPQWYSMQEVSLEAGQTAETYYDITNTKTCSEILQPTEGNWSLVNISMSTDMANLICDRIEIGYTDTIAPGAPLNLASTGRTANSISFSWETTCENPNGDGFDKYKIYIDGMYHGFTSSINYTAHYLEPQREYDIQVTAVDMNKNESPKIISIKASTDKYNIGNELIHPYVNLGYMGAFALPEAFAWMDGDIAFYPDGDPSNTDQYPGSIFCPGNAQQRNVAEINIPVPVISKDINELNMAEIIQPFADIRSANINDGGGNWLKGPALEYLSQQTGQTQGYLYTCFGDYYQTGGERLNSFGACNTDLSNPQPQGGWYIGSPTEMTTPFYMSTIVFNCDIPYEINGHRLIAGGNRYGDWHRGPVLIAYSPWNDGTPLPVNNTQLNYTPLLMYDNSSGTNYLEGYAEYDLWKGASWLTAGNKSAVVVCGLKGFGESWYGWNNGESYELIYCIPTPVEPEGHGPRQSWHKSMLLFYNPADLEAVANGTMLPNEPQPYASIDISDLMFAPNTHNPVFEADVHGPGGMAFDRQNGLLYMLEYNAYQSEWNDPIPVIHVWKLNSNPSAINEQNEDENIKITQNNREITINLPEELNYRLNMYDIMGKLLYANTFHNKFLRHYIDQPAGVYVLKVESGKINAIKKVCVY